MPFEVPYDDLRRDLMGCVVMYKNKPVQVAMIHHNGQVRIRDLFTQREKDVEFTLEEFSKPTPRIGFVNVMGSVFYVARLPVRKYFMGVTTQNTKIHRLGVDYPAGYGDTVGRVQQLAIPEVADAIMNRYPTFEAALEEAKRVRGACAFDKQFAVDRRGNIFYKNDVVGKVDMNATSIQDIVWQEGKEHLFIVLDGNYEKTVRDFRPTA